MELNVNLLPQPEKKRYDLLLLLLLLIFAWVGGGIFGTITYLNAKEKQAQLELEVDHQSQLMNVTYDQLQLSVNEISEENYIAYWQSLYTFLDELYISPHALITDINNQLPPQARIDQLSYQLDGQVTLGGMFAKKEDIATYLENLKKSHLISDAQVNHIQAMDTSAIVQMDTDPSSSSSNIPRYRGELRLHVQAIGGKKE